LLIEGYLSKVSLRVSAMDVAVAAVAVAAAVAAAGAIINAAGRSGNRDSLGEKSLAYVGFFCFSVCLWAGILLLPLPPCPRQT